MMSGETNKQTAINLIAAEMTKYANCRAAGEHALAWRALERAHIIAQPYFVPHLRSHWTMARFALALRDWREVAGQLFRLALVPLGSLTGRLPAGNAGRARVNAFRPMPIPPDLATHFARRDG